MRDDLFDAPIERAFAFDETVAAVFDDMVARSVPFYKENMQLQLDLLRKYLKPGMRIVDLGSSTGTFLIALAAYSPGLRMVGIDNAGPMVALARKKAQAMDADITFVCDDLLTCDLGRADVMAANYTLQFIRPPQRRKAVEKIAASLNPGGLLVCSEKVVFENGWLNKQVIDIYYDYKRAQGYSQTQIMQKREALENVLVPYTIEENVALFKEAGFTGVETLFQWANFVTLVAVREA